MVLAGLQPLGTLFYGVISTVVPLFEAIGVGGIIVGLVSVITARSRPVRIVDIPEHRSLGLADPAS